MSHPASAPDLGANAGSPGSAARPIHRARPVLPLAVVASFAFVAWVAATLATLPPLPGRFQADDFTGVVSVLADLVARLSALATLGMFAGIVGFTPAGPGHTLTAPAEKLARWAGRFGQLWFWSALLLTCANTAYVNGVPMGYTLTPGSWWAFQSATASGLAWLLSALVALGATLTAFGSRQVGPYVGWLIAGTVALAFVAVTGNVSVGLDHDWATDAVIAVTLALVPLGASAVGVLALRGDAGGEHGADTVLSRLRRYDRLVWPLVAVASAFHAVIAWQELAGVSPLATLFGVPTLGFFACLLLLAASSAWRKVSGELVAGRVTAATASASVLRDVVILVAYAAFRTAANHIPPPRFAVPQSIQVNYLGYEMSTPVTLARLLSPGRPNLLWVTLAVACVAAYLWGVRRVHRHGGRWPISRTLFWVAGWGLTLFLATSGLWVYSTVVFSWHMFVHMTVNMLVPVLCVLGAPMTLIESATPDGRPGQLRGLGQLAAGVSDHRVFQALTSPPLLWLAYVGSLFAVYYTPLFPWLMRYHWAHQLMLLFFMITGYAFFNMLIGVDRRARTLPHLVKLALLISIMPFHAIFAVGILSSTSLFGADFYHSIDIAWVGNLMADQNVAGQITWLLGEVPIVIVIVALAAQWFRQDKSDSREFDLAEESGADDQLAAYNEMLHQLAERDAAEARRKIGLRP